MDKWVCTCMPLEAAAHQGGLLSKIGTHILAHVWIATCTSGYCTPLTVCGSTILLGYVIELEEMAVSRKSCPLRSTVVPQNKDAHPVKPLQPTTPISTADEPGVWHPLRW